MADDADVEALLEAPFKDGTDGKRKSKGENENVDKKSKRSGRKSRSGSRSRSGTPSRGKKRSRSRDKRRSTSRDRRRSGSREKRRSGSRDRRRSGSRDRRRSARSRSRDRLSRDRDRSPRRDRDRRDRYERRSPLPPPPRRRSPSPPGITRGRIEGGGRKLPGPERRDVMPFTPRYSPPRDAPDGEFSPEERDARTIFVMQLSQRIRPRDLEEFFSSVGKVRDVRIITDSKTRRSKGIAYIEFWDLASVPLGLGLAGQRLLGVPIIVQPTQSEKNRMASAMLATTFQQNRGPMKLYIGSLHFNITEDMLRDIFEPFGKIDSIQLLKDPETNRSRGYGFVTFHSAEDAKRAMEQLNGFELAGRPMKVGHVTEHQPSAAGQSSLDNDELDRTGIDLGTTGRLQLMAKLAEGTGMQLPSSAQHILNMSQTPQALIQPQQQVPIAPPIATQCFMLSNMFDPAQETADSWDQEIQDDVMEECNKHGGVIHIFVDKASPQGNVYVKCSSIAAAVASVNALHGRWYSGRIITANYVPVPNYHQLFPDSAR